MNTRWLKNQQLCLHTHLHLSQHVPSTPTPHPHPLYNDTQKQLLTKCHSQGDDGKCVERKMKVLRFFYMSRFKTKYHERYNTNVTNLTVI